ncbi:YraN family protein [Novosphingobium sp. MMS21-SN21R]|uniref:YraN family protein n=1 Tax=Novosphingobium sp. MMS21-SN21R TaxID=2969298 RepID=UPI002884AD5B|nr:YraN family protein [Novosphingobium sp. MMS21-SN21R]MDT0507904.1 YraN family protein [Novosphingobium sp. MMS21-SN21R]
MNRAEAEKRGRKGETLAAWYLRLTGWRILARRVKLAAGEVDLIARRGRTVAFVEVKWRRDGGALAGAIDAYRLRRVARASEAVAPKFVRSGDTMQIDVILIAPGQWPRRIANAWQPGA